MQQPRFYFDSENGESFVSEAHRNLIVLVHGLAGNSSRYWGEFRQAILDDPSLAPDDVVFLRYASDRRPHGRLLDWKWGKLASVDEVARRLLNCFEGRNYVQLSVIAHSLGTLVALDATEMTQAETPLTLLLFNAPSTPTFAARFGRAVLGRLNDHVRKSVDQATTSILLERPRASALRRERKMTFVAGESDAIVSLSPDVAGVRRISVPGDHCWFRSVRGHEDPSYTEVAKCLPH